MRPTLPQTKDSAVENFVQQPPIRTVLARTINSDLGAVTPENITLNTSTSWVRIHATTKGVFLKCATAATSATSDDYIHAGGTIDIVAPKERGITIISLIAEEASAKVRVYEYQ
jgi:hypothetical protein